MKIAFYAPMKPPDDPVISGDRETARLILRALEAEGHEIELASRLRTWQRAPDEVLFAEIAAASEHEVARLLSNYKAVGAPDLWITYHLYHKAPDWIGPAVSSALGIPYVVLEGCRARKHAVGPWAESFAIADSALLHADAVAALHAEDAEGLTGFIAADRLFRLQPFVDAARFEAPAHRADDGTPAVLVAVAMMRVGDKEASFKILAEALSRLDDRPWRLLLAGDGARRADILSWFPSERLDWRGMIPPDRIGEIYTAGDIFVWPAINEAFGVALLEAQAAGLPIVAGDAGGVPDIVRDGETGLVVPEGDVSAFTDAVACLLDDADLRRRFGKAARQHVQASHDLSTARRTLSEIMDAAKANRAGTPRAAGAVS